MLMRKTGQGGSVVFLEPLGGGSRAELRLETSLLSLSQARVYAATSLGLDLHLPETGERSFASALVGIVGAVMKRHDPKKQGGEERLYLARTSALRFIIEGSMAGAWK